MAHSHRATLVVLLAAVALAPSPTRAQLPAEQDTKRGLSTTVYDIRDLIEKPAPLSPAQRTQRARRIVETLLAAADPAPAKQGDPEQERIQVLNGTRLVVRATAARHAQFVDMLAALRRLADVTVLVQAQLYAVDDAFYTKVRSAKPLSQDEMEQREREFLAGNAQKRESLFKFLDKQARIQSGEEIKVDDGQAAALLSRQRAVSYRAGPAQVRKGQTALKTILAGVQFLADVQVTADRRFVRLKFTEKAVEVQAINKVQALDADGNEQTALVPWLKEATRSEVLLLPDGGSMLVAVDYQPPAVAGKQPRYVLALTARIRIEEEERTIRNNELEDILPVLLADVLKNPRLKTMRDYYGTPGDKRFALTYRDARDWPEDFRPDVPGYTLTAPQRAGKRLLGIRLDRYQEATESGKATLTVTLVNAGGRTNGAAVGGCTVRYNLRSTDTDWVVELAETAEP